MQGPTRESGAEPTSTDPELRFKELEAAASDFERASAPDSYTRACTSLALLSFIFLFARPQEIITPLGAARLPVIAATLAGLAWIPRAGTTWTKGTKLMFAFLAFEGARGIIGKVVIDDLVANDHWAYHTWKDLFLQFCGVIFPCLVMCSNGPGLRRFFKCFRLIGVFLSLFIITHGGRGPGGFIEDENDAGFVVLFFLPYALSMVTESKAPFSKRFPLLLTAGLGILAVIRTVSRGDFLGLVAVLLYFFWRSQKKFQLLLVALLLFACLLPFISQKYVAEMRSISDTDTGTAEIRRHYWKLAWKLFCDPKNTPIGVGLSNTPYNIARYESGDDRIKFPSAAGRKTHSMYFEVLPDLGLWGAFIYGSIIISCFRTNNRHTKRLQRLLDDLRLGSQIPGGTLASDERSRTISRNTNRIQGELEYVRPLLLATNIAFVAVLSAGAFISVAYYPPFWTLCGITGLLDVYLRKILPASDRYAVALVGPSARGSSFTRGPSWAI